MGIEELARFGAVLRIDVAGALGLAAGFESLAVGRRSRAVAPVLSKGLAELSVDELGQSRGIGLIANVPGLQPGELRVACSRARFGHLGQSEIDRIGEDRGQQRRSVLGCIAGLQMGEVPGEAGPLVDFEEQFGDLDVWQRCRDLVDQILRCLRHRGVEWRDLQA